MGAAVFLHVFVALVVASVSAASPAPASGSQPRVFVLSGDRAVLGEQELWTGLETGNVMLASRAVENFTTPWIPSGTSCCVAQWP